MYVNLNDAKVCILFPPKKDWTEKRREKLNMRRNDQMGFYIFPTGTVVTRHWIMVRNLSARMESSTWKWRRDPAIVLYQFAVITSEKLHVLFSLSSSTTSVSLFRFHDSVKTIKILNKKCIKYKHENLSETITHSSIILRIEKIVNWR